MSLAKQLAILAGRLHGDQRGAAYNLSTIIQIPILIIMIGTAVEVNALLLTQLAVQHASAATARAASVWLPAEPARGNSPEHRLEMIRLAAVQNMMPFASGRRDHQRGLPSDSVGRAYAAFQAEALERLAGRPVDRQAVERKHLYARAAVKIEIEVAAAADPVTGGTLLRSADGLVQVRYIGPAANSQLTSPEIKVRLSFQKAIDLPVVGRFLGHAAPWGNAPFFTREVDHEATATMEGVRSPDQTLGIIYQTY